MVNKAERDEQALRAVVDHLQRAKEDLEPGAGIHPYRIALAVKHSAIVPLVFNDEKARTLIRQAKRGSADADAVLREAICWFLDQGKPLPPNLARYGSAVMRGETDIARRPGRHPWRNNLRNLHIAICVLMLEDDYGYRPTRNATTSGQESGCSIVAQAFEELGMPMSERAVEAVWRDWSKSPMFVQHRTSQTNS